MVLNHDSVPMVSNLICAKKREEEEEGQEEEEGNCKMH